MATINKVMEIDHIAEKIFSALDVSSLKSCRQVAKTWQILPTVQLQNYVSINLESVRPLQLTERETFFQNPSSSSLLPSNIEELLSDIEKSLLFPCTAYETATQDITSPVFQHIFWRLGNTIKKLSLDIYLNPCNNSFNSSEVMNAMLKLLTEQVPNLTSFKLYWEVSADSEGKVCKWDFGETADKPRKAFTLPELKYLKLSNEVPGKLFEAIMDAAIRLNCLSLYWNRNINRDHVKYFDTESNADGEHIKVLRELEFFPRETTIPIVEHFLNHHKNNVSLCYFRIAFIPGFNLSQVALGITLTRILNEILKGSAQTLERFVTDPLRFLSAIEIPLLPKLRELELTISERCIYHEQPTQNFFFPQNFSLKDSFPKLKVIKLASCLNLVEELSEMMRPTESFTSLTKIYVLSKREITKPIIDKVLLLFPKASIFQNGVDLTGVIHDHNNHN